MFRNIWEIIENANIFSEKISVSQELIWKCFLDHSFGYCNIFHDDNYREISNISRAKSQNLNASRLIL